MRHVVAAIDIGGTNTKFGLVDRAGKILFQSTLSTRSFPDPIDLVAHLKSIFEKEVQQLDEASILVGIGIGAPNGNYFTGQIEFAPNLLWKGKVPLCSLFAEAMNCPAWLTNDANAAALGELVYGAAKGMKDFLFITLGTGLGSGIVANGELIYGHDGFAGEVGHVLVTPGGRLCGCGRKGCLETYCSATAIVTTYHELKNSKELVDAKIIADRAHAGEREACEAFRLTGETLGLALANSVAYTSPAAIFLFGGLAHAGELLFAPTRRSFEENLLIIYKNKIKILPSGLHEDDAALLGSASLIWQELGRKKKK